MYAHSLWEMRKRGIWWRGIPHDEKKWGIDQSKMNDFCLNLALLKESLVWNLIIMTKLSHKNAIKLENMPKFLPVPIIWFLRSKNLSI